MIDVATLLWAIRCEHPEDVRDELDIRDIVHFDVPAYVVFACLRWARTKL